MVALAELLVARGTRATRRGPRAARAHPGDAEARVGSRRSPASASTPRTTSPTSSTALLDPVKDDDEARQRYVDLLEVMGADDPRTAGYRKQLTSRLF